MIDVDLPLPPQPTAPPSTVRLIHGDCLEVMPTLAPKSVAMVFADLPYGALKWLSWDIPIDLSRFWQACAYVKQRHGPTVLTATLRFAHVLLASNYQDFSYDLVYEKKLCSSPFMAKKRPLMVHEHILIFNAPSVYNPQMRPEHLRAAISKKPWPGKTKTDKFFQQVNKSTTRMAGDLYPRSILRPMCEDKKKRVHPTQKPVALLEWLVATYTNPGDTVLDPTMGSGSCGVACARLGRNFIGVEKDEAYFKVASKRIADERARLGLSND